MRRTPKLAAAVLAFLLAVGVTACGDDSSGQPAEQQPSEQPAGETESVHHIHGLGVDPNIGTLYVATHTGLFQASQGEQRMRRIGDSAQDIMGFSVVTADRFIGSGHPDPNDTGSPPNLGLIESRDRGGTWKNISLLGEADFHVLRSSGARIYGYDGTQGRLMVSNDGGRQWAQRTPPAAMFDLAIDPRDPDRIVASTERGVFASQNAGKAWRPLRDDTAGLLAWPAADRLYLVDGQGRVQRSGDGGRQWQPTGTIGGQPVAFIAHGSELYAALSDSTVKRSEDGGASWTLRAAP
ncbi:MAG: F510_1955 family glycosylhydrolase [Solirubrobacteraceae bacterium]